MAWLIYSEKFHEGEIDKVVIHKILIVLLFLCKNLILWVHIRLEPLTDTTLQNQELANRKILNTECLHAQC